MDRSSTVERIATALFEVRDKGSDVHSKLRMPTITISREVGGLGTTVAQALGEHLGWEVYDNELIEEIARGLEAPHSQVERLDERTVNWLEEMLTGFVSNQAVSPYAYLKYLVATVEGLGAIGNCVIVGRGANCILPATNTLRVRLIASLADRVRVIAALRQTSGQDAKEYIEKTEKSRTEFVRGNFNRDPEDPHEYDLILNTSRVNVPSCVEVIARTLRQLYPVVTDTSPVG